MELWQLLGSKDNQKFLRSKAMRLGQVDAIIKYFYTRVKIRGRRTKIMLLQVVGYVNDILGIESEVICFFLRAFLRKE